MSFLLKFVILRLRQFLSFARGLLCKFNNVSFEQVRIFFAQVRIFGIRPF